MFRSYLTLVYLSAFLAASNAFVPASFVGAQRRATLILDAATADATSTAAFPVRQVETEEDVLNIASFRNDLTNPKMMVEQANQKRQATDNTAKALDGLKIGFLYVGPIFAALEYGQSQSISDATQIYAAVGGTVGVILAVNNYIGKSVHVPDVPEAENRILVDFAEGLKRRKDLGFAAMSDDYKFEPCGGIMGCVDGQLRNSPDSPPGVQTIPNYPTHVHIKNMLVHESQRRQGVGQALLDAFETYAKEQTDAELMTLEVEEENEAAVQLYQKAGYEYTKHPTTFLTKRKYMVKKL